MAEWYRYKKRKKNENIDEKPAAARDCDTRPLAEFNAAPAFVFSFHRLASNGTLVPYFTHTSNACFISSLVDEPLFGLAEEHFAEGSLVCFEHLFH